MNASSAAFLPLPFEVRIRGCLGDLACISPLHLFQLVISVNSNLVHIANSPFAAPRPVTMPRKLKVKPRQISLEALTRSSFAPFGYVIENPISATSHSHAPYASSAFPAPVPANQGTALKYPDISHLTSTYHLSSRPETAKPVISLFVCSPRRLRPLPRPQSGQTPNSGGRTGGGILSITILERHPYTTQTFSPLSLSPSDDARTAYIVVVTPTLRSGPEAGLPDLANVRAFLARGGQAVTYGVGTWHAPMVVVGEREVGFVVVQVANGTGDDCEEVELVGEGGGDGVEVVVGELGLGRGGVVKARL